MTSYWLGIPAKFCAAARRWLVHGTCEHARALSRERMYGRAVVCTMATDRDARVVAMLEEMRLKGSRLRGNGHPGREEGEVSESAAWPA